MLDIFSADSWILGTFCLFVWVYYPLLELSLFVLVFVVDVGVNCSQCTVLFSTFALNWTLSSAVFSLAFTLTLVLT